MQKTKFEHREGRESPDICHGSVLFGRVTWPSKAGVWLDRVTVTASRVRALVLIYYTLVGGTFADQ
jgi:hypothetical protein